MSLTREPGPLAPQPAESNYAIDGPAHRILFTPFTRRLRAELGGETVIDTRSARLLHETAIRARLYVPLADVRADLLEPSDTTSHCPFKGDASYRSIRVGERLATDALWVYDEPLPEAPWLAGHAGVYEDRLDRWLDEDEEILGHVRDPFHRVDARRSSRHVHVTGPGGAKLAESRSAVLVAETGLEDRFYFAREDVAVELTQGDRESVCPYKGRATYWSAPGLPNVAWSYQDPLEGVSAIAGRVAFKGEGVEVAEVG